MKGVEKINPYDSHREKGEQVEEMFDSIAPAYDFMNNAMTFGLYRFWRNEAIKKALSYLETREVLKVLDVATGTGDLAFYLDSRLRNAEIKGIDLSAGMLEIARKKFERHQVTSDNKISFEKADCLDLPFSEATFDIATVAYGVRNFSNLLKGLEEIKRVLKPGGVICIIELSTPEGSLTAPFYKIYSGILIPLMGRIISHDSHAYSYLPESIRACPQRENMKTLMSDAGFSDVKWKSLTFGAVTYYIGKRGQITR